MQSYLRSAIALISLVIGAAIALFLAYWLAIGFIIGLGLVAALGLFGWISGGFVARSRHRYDQGGYDQGDRDKDGRFVLTIDGESRERKA